MNFKTFLANIKEEFNVTMTKSFDKIEVFSRIMKLKSKANTLSAEIIDIKKDIGEYVFQEKEEFYGNETLIALIKRIETLEGEIVMINDEIDEIKMQNREEEAEIIEEENDEQSEDQE